jgi:hypothetical protein
VLNDENVCTTIPRMRSYEYAKGYENYVQARATIAELAEMRGLDICSDCSDCSVFCRRGIGIGSRVKTLISERL